MPDAEGNPKPRKKTQTKGVNKEAIAARLVQPGVEVDPKATPAMLRLQLKGKMAELHMGLRSIKDMDDEELTRMQYRDKNGGFSGRPSGALPRPLVQKIRAELLERASKKFDSHLIDSIDVLGSIMKSDTVSPADRIKAAVIIIDRVMGKTPDKIEMTAELKPWQGLIESIDRSMGAPDAGLEGVRTIDG